MDLLERILEANPELSQTDDAEVLETVGTPPGEGVRVERSDELLDLARELAGKKADRRSLRGRFRAEGMEALGKYVTFRLRPDDYGVHLRADALLALVDEIHQILNRYVAGHLLTMDPGFVEEFEMRRAVELALGHFDFHHITDVTTARVEIPRDEPLYFPYIRKVYLPGLAEGRCLEEQCANIASVEPYFNYGLVMERLRGLDAVLPADDAVAVKALFTGSRFASEMVLAMKEQPPAYSEFTAHMGRDYHVGATSHMVVDYTVEPEKWREAKGQLALQILQGRITPEPPDGEVSFWAEEHPPEAPVHLV
jgi:hypothetical protein